MDWLNDLTKQTGDVFQGAGQWTGEATQGIVQWSGEQTQNVAAAVPKTLNVGECMGHPWGHLPARGGGGYWDAIASPASPDPLSR
jgi:hypothetical protein